MSTDDDLSQQLKLLIDQYNGSVKDTSKYFDYMYRTVGFFITGITAIMVYAIGSAYGFAYQFVFIFAIPILTYIFGLFYCYNALAILKCNYYEKVAEVQIKAIWFLKYHNLMFFSRTEYYELNRRGYLITYGTLLMLFIVFPAVCIWLGYNHLYKVLLFPFTTLNDPYLIISLLCYCIYMVFIVILISAIMDLRKKINKTKAIIRWENNCPNITLIQKP